MGWFQNEGSLPFQFGIAWVALEICSQSGLKLRLCCFVNRNCPLKESNGLVSLPPARSEDWQTESEIPPVATADP